MTRASGKSSHVASEHAGNRARGADRRNNRRRIENEMRNRGRKAAGEIEGKIASVPQPILHGRAEQPERPHIEDEVEPAAMEKHHGEHRNESPERELTVGQACGVTRRYEGEIAQEHFELKWTEAVLEQEDQAVCGNQYPGDHRRIPRWNSVLKRDHFRSCQWVALAPEETGRLGVPACAATVERTSRSTRRNPCS